MAKESKLETQEMDSHSSTTENTESKVASHLKSINEIYPEVETFLSLLVLVWLLDSKNFDAAKNLANFILERLDAWNRRTLDPLSSKVYFYYARCYELTGSYAEIRPKLFSLHRTAVLHHNIEGQTCLLNLLIRNFLEFNLYDQADKLISNVDFKEEEATSQEIARHYYYQGRIKSIDPEQYSVAFEHLQQALRKAPSHSALGFRVAVCKLLIIVQLLIGEIPERSLFQQKGFATPLKPYMKLTSSVRFGDLPSFQSCIVDYQDTFIHDKTLSLIHRMRNNVIKIGLKKINASYSRISLQDISNKLGLENVQDAEFIVAKAIKENIIDAHIVHSQGYVLSNESTDIYNTKEPQEQFSLRTDFFLKIHNDAMKAMRYSPDESKKNQDSDELKEKLLNEQELASAISEGDWDDFF